MNDVARWLGGALVGWACLVAVGLPFIATALWSLSRRGRDVGLGRLLLLAVFFFVSLALTRLGMFWTLVRDPWQTMILEAAWALAFILGTRSVSRAGLTWRISARAWRDSLIVTGVLLVFVVARSSLLRFLGIGVNTSVPVAFEYLLYQLTMPGVAEELCYRGVIQPGLNRSLGRPWKLWGAQVGWGWVITSLIFWALHAFRVDSQMRLTFYWPTLTMQLIVGFALGWMRERTGSLFPSMLAHNLVNVVWTLV